MCDYTGDIDIASIRALEAVADAAERTGIGWIVTGAMARSLIFETVHGCAGGRYTRDWDLGLWVQDWPHFRALEHQLLEHGGFRSDLRQRQRMHAPGGMIVDFIPFGGVETDDKQIRWDDGDHHVLQVAGFRETFEASYQVRLNNCVTARVVSPAGLTLLKLMAWQDRHLEHDRDAEDLAFLFRNFDSMILDDLYERYSDVMAAMDFDPELAATCVLGGQASALAGFELRDRVRRWLDDALMRPEESALLVSLARYMALRRHEALQLLQAFRTGWTG